MLLTDRQTDRQTERIDWIDIAKGIAIILVIVGHTVEFGGLTRNFIFSFHMPLFFMLSGYTTRLAKDLMECRKHLRKNALHLIGPCLCIGVLSIFAQWLKGGSLSFDAFWQITRTTADAYYWASGVSLPKHPAAGAVWFLFSLFWAKTCMDAISLCFSKKRSGIIFLAIGMLGLLLGWRGKWLPQNADVTMVAVLFIYLGMVWKEYAEIFDRYELGIFLAVSCVWLYCLRLGIYIEMAGRSYPYLSVSVLEAVCGTFAICSLCKALEENKQIKDLMVFIGRHTLLIFSMHCLDWIAVDAWMNHWMWIRNIVRTCMVLGCSLLFYETKNAACHVFERHAKN